MSATFIMRTLLEFSAVMLLIVGYIYEDKVIAFERAVKRVIVGNIKRYIRIKNHKNLSAEERRANFKVHEGGKSNPHKPINVA